MFGKSIPYDGRYKKFLYMTNQRFAKKNEPLEARVSEVINFISQQRRVSLAKRIQYRFFHLPVIKSLYQKIRGREYELGISTGVQGYRFAKWAQRPVRTRNMGQLEIEALEQPIKSNVDAAGIYLQRQSDRVQHRDNIIVHAVDWAIDMSGYQGAKPAILISDDYATIVGLDNGVFDRLIYKLNNYTKRYLMVELDPAKVLDLQQKEQGKSATPVKPEITTELLMTAGALIASGINPLELAKRDENDKLVAIHKDIDNKFVEETSLPAVGEAKEVMAVPWNERGNLRLNVVSTDTELKELIAKNALFEVHNPFLGSHAVGIPLAPSQVRPRSTDQVGTLTLSKTYSTKRVSPVDEELQRVVTLEITNGDLVNALEFNTMTHHAEPLILKRVR
ncbi:MAG: hypothetical protein AB7J37_07495 [Candidatus Melainabacteria bacterium]